MKTKIRPIPEGYHSVTPNLILQRAGDAIEFYKKAFGAELSFRQDRPDGRVAHATVTIGDSILMLADECPPHKGHEEECVRSPEGLKGTTVNLYFYVKDVDAAFERAVKEGAQVAMPLSDMFWGDRVGMLKDPFGHFWTLATQKERLSPQQLKERSEKFFSQQPTCC